MWEDIISSVGWFTVRILGIHVAQRDSVLFGTPRAFRAPWRGSKSLATIQNHVKSPSSSDYFVLHTDFSGRARASETSPLLLFPSICLFFLVFLYRACPVYDGGIIILNDEERTRHPRTSSRGTRRKRRDRRKKRTKHFCQISLWSLSSRFVLIGELGIRDLELISIFASNERSIKYEGGYFDCCWEKVFYTSVKEWIRVFSRIQFKEAQLNLCLIIPLKL